MICLQLLLEQRSLQSHDKRRDTREGKTHNGLQNENYQKNNFNSIRPRFWLMVVQKMANGESSNSINKCQTSLAEPNIPSITNCKKYEHPYSRRALQRQIRMSMDWKCETLVHQKLGATKNGSGCRRQHYQQKKPIKINKPPAVGSTFALIQMPNSRKNQKSGSGCSGNFIL